MKSSVLHYSLFVGLLGIFADVCSADAALRITNYGRRNYADANRQKETKKETMSDSGFRNAPAKKTINESVVGSVEQTAETDTVDVLVNGGTLSPDVPENCARIYPDGRFAWVAPDAGSAIGGTEKCSAVVQLYAYGAAPDGGNVLLATAHVAAGDMIRCNIDEFPSSGIVSTQDDNLVVYVPASREPTIEDVIAVMNEEQKQNAAMKIVSATLVSGLAGNFLGKGDPSSTSPLGTDSGKLKGTAIGALGGAAVMAGHLYTGKVAGDVILSTGVNAATGAAIGNMVSDGDSVLRIEKCEIDGQQTSCLYGYIDDGKSLDSSKVAYCNPTNNECYVCDKVSSDAGGCTDSGGSNTDRIKTCKITRLTNVYYKVDGSSVRDDKLTGKEIEKIEEDNWFKKYNNPTDGCIVFESGLHDDDKGKSYLKVSSAQLSGKSTPVMIANVSDSTFGRKKAYWDDIKANKTTNDVYTRQGKVFKDCNNVENDSYTVDCTDLLDRFRPQMLHADDGQFIDVNNKARLKDTLVGAGAGGALGAFTAYQGAQNDIQERWLSEVRNYKDSLTKFYCVTGDRFLGSYNSDIEIPPVSE